MRSARHTWRGWARIVHPLITFRRTADRDFQFHSACLSARVSKKLTVQERGKAQGLRRQNRVGADTGFRLGKS